MPASPSAQCEERTIDDSTCPNLLGALELVGRRWTGGILAAAAHGARRHSEYRRMVGGLSDRLLTQRLKELAAEGLIERTVTPTTPVQIRYDLTPDGQSLLNALQPLVQWMANRSVPAGAAQRPVHRPG
ncbi:winged helix-turn-helix transcriptional regulator [Streptomyces sp. 142MFCol3.1]|uniref:winged helix-turn-helix transcriptional regulator n=1 Tax=Streptomyces sp. 142MFCol3.1 TaxID=1172179 RepID=UPI0006843235|nr:helix-turn-helix domain-containing protein [Streptomyces sp. 142MFCol3.1]